VVGGGGGGGGAVVVEVNNNGGGEGFLIFSFLSFLDFFSNWAGGKALTMSSN